MALLKSITPFRRNVCISISNQKIGDGYWGNSLAAALRALADKVEAHELFNDRGEAWEDDEGNKILLTSGSTGSMNHHG